MGEMDYTKLSYREQVAEYIRFTEGNKLKKIQDLADYANKGGILFLGDSLTEGFPTADLLPEYQIVNRGYSGDTTEKLKERLPYSCYPYEPRAVFLQVGTNDLAQGISETEVISHIDEICAEIKRRCKTKLYLIALYPKNETEPRFLHSIVYGDVSKRTNVQIRKTNELLRAYAERAGLRFLDFGSVLQNAAGELRADYSSDGLHLTVAGYAALSKAIKPYLDENKRKE